MRKFTLDAKLMAEVGSFDEIPRGDLMMVPGEFVHPMHGKFNLAFGGDPPRLIVMHGGSQRIGQVHIQAICEAVGKELIRKLQ